MYKLNLVREAVPGTEADILIKNPHEAAAFLGRYCYTPENSWRESCWAIALNSGNRVIGYFLVSMGSVTQTAIDPVLVAKVAVDTCCRKVILSHNHPGGDPAPSETDIKQTSAAQKALQLFGIKLIDHVIVGEGRYYSMEEERLYVEKEVAA